MQLATYCINYTYTNIVFYTITKEKMNALSLIHPKTNEIKQKQYEIPVHQFDSIQWFDEQIASVINKVHLIRKEKELHISLLLQQPEIEIADLLHKNNCHADHKNHQCKRWTESRHNPWYFKKQRLEKAKSVVQKLQSNWITEWNALIEHIKMIHN